jgi:predicted acyl esterase
MTAYKWLDMMPRNTSAAFFDVIEWAADQAWSSGKVGLLGISYYAGSQWRVVAMKLKGLAAIDPWEGMSDGILSNNFINFWWNRQVVDHQYGRPRNEEIIKTSGAGPTRDRN